MRENRPPNKEEMNAQKLMRKCHYGQNGSTRPTCDRNLCIRFAISHDKSQQTSLYVAKLGRRKHGEGLGGYGGYSPLKLLHGRGGLT